MIYLRRISLKPHPTVFDAETLEEIIVAFVVDWFN